MSKKDKKIRTEQQEQTDLLAASKPVMANQEGAEAAQQVHEGLDGESGQRWAHGDSRSQNRDKAALNESAIPDANTVGAVPPQLADAPRFPRPGSLEIDSDGLAGSPAEMLNPGVPLTEAVDTLGQSLAPAPSQPVAAQWASELADARQGAAQMLKKLTPAGDVERFAGFMQSKGRQGDTGQYAPIPGGSEVAELDEVQTFDEMTRPGSAGSLRGAPQAPRPDSMGPMGAQSVIRPSIRNVGADAIESARS